MEPTIFNHNQVERFLEEVISNTENLEELCIWYATDRNTYFKINKNNWSVLDFKLLGTQSNIMGTMYNNSNFTKMEYKFIYDVTKVFLEKGHLVFVLDYCHICRISESQEELIKLCGYITELVEDVILNNEKLKLLFCFGDIIINLTPTRY